MVMLQWTKVAVVLNCVKSYSKYGLVVGTRKHDHETHKRWGIYEAAARLLAFQEDTFCVELVYQTLVGVWCLFRLWLSGLWHLLSLCDVCSDCGCLVYDTSCPSLPLFRRTCWCILETISPPPERWKYFIRLHGVIIQETTILDLYRCESLNCHIGIW